MQWHDIKRLDDGRWEMNFDDGRSAISLFKADDLETHLLNAVTVRIAGARAMDRITGVSKTDDPCVYRATFADGVTTLEGRKNPLSHHGLNWQSEDAGARYAVLRLDGDLLFGKLFSQPISLEEHLRAELAAKDAALESAKRAADEATARLAAAEGRIEQLVEALRVYSTGTPPIELTSRIGQVGIAEKSKKFHAEIDAMRLAGWSPKTVTFLSTADDATLACVWLEREALPDGVQESQSVGVVAAAEAVIAGL